MLLIRYAVIACLAQFLVPDFVMAETVVPYRDDALKSAFPVGYPAEVRGFRLGMTVDEVMSHAREEFDFMNASGRKPTSTTYSQQAPSTEEALDFGYASREFLFKLKKEVDVEGGWVSVETEPFIQAIEIMQAADFGSIVGDFSRTFYSEYGERFSFIVGSPLSGARVQIIEYDAYFDEPLDLETVKKSVFEKFGQEPYALESREALADFGASYVFESEKQSSTVYDVFTCLNFQARKILFDRDEVFYYFFPNGFDTKESDEFIWHPKGCDAVVQVSLFTDNVTSVSRLSILIEDKSAIKADNDKLTNFFRTESERHLKEPGGKLEAPDL